MQQVNNILVDDAHDIDVVMPMYNLTEYSDNYSKTSGILWKYCRDDTAVDRVPSARRRWRIHNCNCGGTSH